MNGWIEYVESHLPPGWSIYDEEMGMECLLECPHGSVIEQDGRCPKGCVSPLRLLGLI